MELLQLRYFCSVAQVRNISQAARDHRVPQPAMSKTISKLESELGVKLFNRIHNRLTLTPEGTQFYENVRQALLLIDQGAQDIRDEGGELAGNIYLLVNQHKYFVADCVSRFKQRYPDTLFYISQDRQTNYHMYDYIIASDPPSPVCLDRTLLVRERVVAAVPLSRADRFPERLAIPDIAAEPIISFPLGSTLCNTVIEQFRLYDLKPNFVAFVDDPASIVECIRKGMGIAFIPDVTCSPLMGPDIRLLPTDCPDLSTYAYRSNTRASSRATRVFLDFMRSQTLNAASPRPAPQRPDCVWRQTASDSGADTGDAPGR